VNAVSYSFLTVLLLLFLLLLLYDLCSDELRALGPHPGSAELHPQVAAEASYKIFTEVKAISMFY
jgi:hypothetical protein